MDWAVRAVRTDSSLQRLHMRVGPCTCTCGLRANGSTSSLQMSSVCLFLFVGNRCTADSSYRTIIEVNVYKQILIFVRTLGGYTWLYSRVRLLLHVCRGSAHPPVVHGLEAVTVLGSQTSNTSIQVSIVVVLRPHSTVTSHNRENTQSAATDGNQSIIRATT